MANGEEHTQEVKEGKWPWHQLFSVWEDRNWFDSDLKSEKEVEKQGYQGT